MCLVTKQICPQRARKDIICYKAFRQRFKLLETPFLRTRIFDPKYTEESVLMDDSDREVELEKVHFRVKSRVHHGYTIKRGMIHAFRTYEAFKRYFASTYLYYRVYKCIIPKGTLYYVGINEDICAKQMLVVERVNSNTAE